MVGYLTNIADLQDDVWKFALKSVFKVLKPRSLKKKGAPEEEIQAAKTLVATFIRDGLLRLGRPSSSSARSCPSG